MATLTLEGLEKLPLIIEEKINIKQAEKAMGVACAFVEAEAKKRAPKGNGDLRRSITSKVEVEGKEVTGTVFTPLFYAPYVEFGTGLFAEGGNGRKDVPWSYQDDKGDWHSTSGMHPHPYLRPALIENQETIEKIIMEGIADD